MKIAGCQPDSGNPTVRDERGAYGNVDQGGTRNPRHNRKGACRKLSAYRCARRISTRRAGHTSTGVTRELGRAIDLLAYKPGLGDRVTKGPGVVGGLLPGHEPNRDSTNAQKQARYREASDERSDPRWVGWQS